MGSSQRPRRGQTEAVSIAAALSNSLAGTLTAQLRQIEQLSSWRSNRELRHWHKQFVEARDLLATRPPQRVHIPTVEAPDADNITWMELTGAR